MDEVKSYIYGLLITDGSLHLSIRNRGKVTLEIAEIDEDIVDKLVELIPNSHKYKRTRDTNFKKNYTTIISTNHQKSFREELIKNGFPTTDKTLNANTPNCEYDEIAFWRGVIDGDGSVGITNKGLPFISLVTKSESLKESYLNFLFKQFSIKKNIHRNKRDNVYNILVMYDNAIKIANLLYNNNDIHLNRKYEKAKMLFEHIKS